MGVGRYLFCTAFPTHFSKFKHLMKIYVPNILGFNPTALVSCVFSPGDTLLHFVLCRTVLFFF